ncbi:MAG: ABC transporter permease [Alphaproteobacteria bacterium]|nr:ABC transporter permease [Alphaproteobacteria bacterium]
MLDSFFIELRRSPVLALAAALILAAIAIAVLAPVLAPKDPNLQNLRATLAPPSAGFPLGTDEYGRDLLSRMIFGMRNSLIVGAAVVLLSGLIGAVLGISAGYFGGWLDMVVMRLADIMMAFPYLVLALGLIAALGAGIPSTIVALTVAFAPIYVRIVRSKVLVVKEEAYVEAARLIGVRPRTIAVRHVLPNVAGPMLVQGALTFAFAVLAEASLSFVGLGVPPPAASFGNIIAAGRDHIIDAPWIATSSGVAIVALVLSLLILADGLRDAIDPYQHRL